MFTEILSKQSTDKQDKESQRKISFCLGSGIPDKDLSEPAQTQEPVILSFKPWHCGGFYCIYLLYILIKPDLQVILNVHNPNGFLFVCFVGVFFVVVLLLVENERGSLKIILYTFESLWV